MRDFFLEFYYKVIVKKVSIESIIELEISLTNYVVILYATNILKLTF